MSADTMKGAAMIKDNNADVASLASDDLAGAVADLRRQVAELVEKGRAVATERVKAVSGEIVEGVDEATAEAMRRGREARAALETSIHDHPMAAVGVAAGLGLLLGLAMRR